MAGNDAWFVKDQKGAVKIAQELDDYLHPSINAGVSHYAATETQGHLFSVPEAGITCVGYLWHHPNLHMLSGGCMAWQDKKVMPLGCELFDMRSFMSELPLANDIGDYTLDNGYRAVVIEPLKRFQMQYEDAARGNAFDVELRAVSPAVLTSSGRHFDQIMHAKGEIHVRGKRYRVDDYCTRDRSWGEARSEAMPPFPAACWLNGIFGEDFAFNCLAIDHPDCEPLWGKECHIPGERTLLNGWVWRDGEVTPIVSVRKKTEYDTLTMIPRRVELHFLDAKQREYNAIATSVNAAPMNTWPNFNGPVFLSRWECNGFTGWGECQDLQWNDFVQAHLASG